ncbi:MAG: ribosome biogenesis GTPase Der [Clostridia bacterium]|nr:ribosome biogenesis GTPase Der [Clostridia bacterium]MBO7157698.1 ribosome biogenesis GTPase Der [Clostridia bacterium]MBQ1255628.1 ribosome biogenesis GTPase Der [Clostridia bacterium]MBQ5791447.1 ribosome biogenesis GTPase Der [Clostridia bacterium]
MAQRVVAVVGRPNVGKSTLFNRLTGSRISIVEDTPGVTRDRIYHEVEWNGETFMLIDTGGIEPITDSTLLVQMRDQAQVAIEHADVILFMCDLQSGMTDSDNDIATMLRKARKPVIVIVNKVDSIGATPAEFYEFYGLGFEDVFPLSSLSGTGTGDILDRVLELLPKEEEEENDDDRIRIAVIGKPNAGKSSIINKICGEDRVIVSDMAGTTRDAVDTYVENKYGKYVLVDTAGIRRNAKIEDKIEKYSVLRANMAVENSDVCLVMIDANQGVTAQDEHIAGIAHNAGKASVIVVNKWDLLDKDNSTFDNYRKDVYNALSYMTYAPVVFVSAKTGQRVDKIFTLVNDAYKESCKRITTGVLNDFLSDITDRVQPPTDKGRRLKIYYMTQTTTNPPTFALFCNSAELFHYSYQRYIENCLRKTFGFEGTPIRLVIKQKGE